jgi:uncharacterized protein (DUF1697 family)
MPASQALVVFLRGVNVGGHRTFRPARLAKELAAYDVVNIGAAGTFVVRKPGSRTRFKAELMRRLPFETDVMICDGKDLLRLATKHPFGAAPPDRDVTRFLSVFPESLSVRTKIPITLPAEGRWLLRVIAARKQFAFGMYRRHMKTIGYLGQMDRMFGTRATTRSWNTIDAIVRILKDI